MENLVKKIKKKLVWYNYLEKYKKIMIFGAKDSAHITYLLVKGSSDIECFVVSKRDDNPLFLDGKQVKILDELDEEDKRTALIIISLIFENHDNIKSILSRKGFKNIIPSMTQYTCKLTDDLRKYCESLLGNIRMIEEVQNGSSCKQKACIYVVTSSGDTHKTIRGYKSKYVKYIYAGNGSFVNQEICALRDNTGDNISSLNPYFCELSAGYWIYRNDIINDYVGLYHYSRGLDITDEQIEHIINANIDVVLPKPNIYRYGMATYLIEAQYLGVAGDSLEDVLEAIYRISPEYLDSAELYFSEKIFFAGNILFSKKIIFCTYYEWMFKILNECEKIRKSKGKKIALRIWGYIGEHLTNIYFLKHIKEYNVVYSEMKFMF